MKGWKEWEGMSERESTDIANAPGNSTLFTSWWSLICLTFNAKIHQMITTDSAHIHNNVLMIELNEWDDAGKKRVSEWERKRERKKQQTQAQRATAFHFLISNFFFGPLASSTTSISSFVSASCIFSSSAIVLFWLAELSVLCCVGCFFYCEVIGMCEIIGWWLWMIVSGRDQLYLYTVRYLCFSYQSSHPQES